MNGAGLVFFIASHRNPDQVVRLVRRLLRDLPNARIVVHHDRTQSVIERDALPDGVDLIEDSIAVRWGDASQVRATMLALAFIERTYRDYSYVVFLSGQDYPIKHLGTLPATLATMGDGQLCVEPPGIAEPLRYELTWYRLPARLQTPRIREVFQCLIERLNHRQRFVRFAAGRIGCSIGVRVPSPLPKGWTCFQGSNWWALGRRAIAAVLATRRERRALFEWLLERSIIPDEGVFQTILLNDPSLHFVNTDLRHIRWDDRNSGSPVTFTIADANELEHVGAFLARKFDAELDSAILDRLDEIALAAHGG